MPSLAGLKGLIWGLVLVIAYSSMVIDIIGIDKVRIGENVRSDATIAMLCGAILNMLWAVYYFIKSGRGAIYTASSAVAGFGLWFVWQIVTTAITAAYYLQHRTGYCSDSSTNLSDCSGVFRGVMGLGFALAGINLIAILYHAALVSSSGAAWSDQLYDVPARAIPNADLEKAPAH